MLVADIGAIYYQHPCLAPGISCAWKRGLSAAASFNIRDGGPPATVAGGPKTTAELEKEAGLVEALERR